MTNDLAGDLWYNDNDDNDDDDNDNDDNHDVDE